MEKNQLISEEREAIADHVLDLIRTGSWKETRLILERTADPEYWCNLLRYELTISNLTENRSRPLHLDVLLPHLTAVCESKTISIFHYAALCGADEVLRQSIQFGLSVDTCLENGSTALHLACFAGMIDTVRMLINEFHADGCKTDRYLWGPLHYASSGGHMPVVNFLLEYNPNSINQRDKDGTTAAFRAIACRHPLIEERLLSVSGDPDILLVNEAADEDLVAEPIYARVQKTKSNAWEIVEMISPNDTFFQTESNPYSEIEIKDDKMVLSKDEEKSGLESSTYCQVKRTSENSTNLKTAENNHIEKSTRIERVRKIIQNELKNLELAQHPYDSLSSPYAVPQNKKSSNEETIDIVTLGQLLKEEVSRYAMKNQKIRNLASKAEPKNKKPNVSKNQTVHSGVYEEILSVIQSLPKISSKKIPPQKSNPPSLPECSVQSNTDEDGKITIIWPKANYQQKLNAAILTLTDVPYITGQSSFYA